MDSFLLSLFDISEQSPRIGTLISQIPKLYVITITNYDIFGEDYMMYTFRNRCEEVPNLEYEDGLQFIYFYTKGQKGGSQAIKNMLTYFQNSDSKNAVDDATKMIDRYVRKVKSLPEVEAGYIIDNKEKVAAKIRERYPDYAENADELVEKYW